jgi:hypothetical protein
MNGQQIFKWSIRFVVLLVLFYVFFISGTMAISGLLPDVPSEPGLLPNDMGMLILGISNTLLVIGLILSSRWHGWKLVLGLAFAYYGAVTFLTQIETWYFLSQITVDEKLLSRLFIMGLPVAFVYIPLAVWILGKIRSKDNAKPSSALVMPARQWVWKLMVIGLAYLVLYWIAGYFIAWQNPNLRAFYGSPGEIVPFWQHTANTLHTDPGLFPFQFLRAMLWTLCALPIIRGSKLNTWWTTVLLGLFFTIPQCLGLLIENPLMPNASVRLSHLIEGLTSNFIFAVIIAWLLHREHKSLQDLFGISSMVRKSG